MADERIVREVDGRRLSISNPDKLLFPDPPITKGALIDHYERCAPFMLPLSGGRPLTLRRYPDGIDTDGWFQKHAPAHLPDWVTTARVPRSVRGDTTSHIVLDSTAVLVYLANLAAIELHVGPAPADDPDHPAELVIDLDPPAGADARVVRKATRRCRDLLEDLGLPGRLKSTGSSGFHIHVALDGSADQDLSRNIARAIATVLAGRYPAEMTVEHRIDKRGDRVFVDWLRNSPRQTFVAPYSVRPRPGAPVATPMAWSELSGTHPGRWNIQSLRRRLARGDDPWQGEPRAIDLRAITPAVQEALAEVA